MEDARINKRSINMSRFSIKLMYVFRLAEHAYNENCEVEYVKCEARRIQRG